MPRPYTRRSAPEGAPVETETTQQPVSPRAAEMRRERRRRNDGDLDGMAQLKLQIPREVKEQGEREGKVFRFFLETNVPDAFHNDWDKVEGVEQPVANPIAGQGERLVLCSKYKDWHEADIASEMKIIDAREAEQMQGHVSGDDGSSEGLYVPKGAVNRVSRQQGL